MSINWGERFSQTKTAYSNVQPEINELRQKATDYRIEAKKIRENNVGAGGAITKFVRINASSRQNYPACAKWNFAIIDSEGRQRFLTPFECSDKGFCYVKGTSESVPFLKNLGDPFYIAFIRAEERFDKEIRDLTRKFYDQADEIEKLHRDKPWRWPLYQQYLNSKEWALKKKEVLFRDDYCCQLCGEVENLNVHHLTYNRVGDEALFDLVTFCRSCHEIEHGKVDRE